MSALALCLRQCALLVMCAFSFLSCSTVPVTGRRQLNLVSSAEINTLAAQQYQQLLSQSQVERGTPQSAMVNRVGARIAQAVTQYLQSQGQGQLVEGYQWEFTLIQSNEPNAFCMPGGKIGIYTGILPYTKNEDGLAVVMGHEVAHAIAQHSNERMSQQMATQLGTSVVSEALNQNAGTTNQLLLAAVGLGAQVGILLPFSRTQESEADRLGLIFAAKAGYNPREAIPFWQRMSQAGGGQSPPEWLSTHPSNETRIRNLERYLPEALAAAQ